MRWRARSLRGSAGNAPVMHTMMPGGRRSAASGLKQSALAQRNAAGFAKEDDAAVIKIFPGISLPEANK